METIFSVEKILNITHESLPEGGKERERHGLKATVAETVVVRVNGKLPARQGTGSAPAWDDFTRQGNSGPVPHNY